MMISNKCPTQDLEGQGKLEWKVSTVRSKSGELKSMANGKIDADDIVWQRPVGWPTDDVEQLSSNDYPTTEPGPTLLDLIIASYVTHNAHSKYNLFRRQCYWYAATVADVIESEFQPRRLQERYNAALKRSSGDIEFTDQQFHPKDGTWNDFLVHKVQPGIVAGIHQDFLEERGSLMRKVSNDFYCYCLWCLRFCSDFGRH